LSRLKRLKWKVERLFTPADFSKAQRFHALPVGPLATGPIVVHMLWVEGALSQLERLSCASFVQNGYDVRLWSYGKLSGVPGGVTLCDGREILPEERLFRYKNGSYAGFADLFRYAVLARRGGLWADIDLVCLLPEARLRARLPNGFLVTESIRRASRRQLTNNLIYCPHPRKGDVVDLALAIADRFDTSAIAWGDCGPRLLTWLAKSYPALLPPVMEPEFANPLPPRMCPEVLLEPGRPAPAHWTFLHCYNEKWRRRGMDKSLPWHPDSIMGRLAARYPAEGG
jgi:hypothetical protein